MYIWCIMLSKDFMCVYSPFLIAFCVFTGVSSNSLSESLKRGLFLDKSIPKFEFLSGGPCLAVLSKGYVFFCRLTRPRLVLLGNIVSAFLEAAMCRYRFIYSINLNKAMFKVYSFLFLTLPVVSFNSISCSRTLFKMLYVHICERLAQHP